MTLLDIDLQDMKVKSNKNLCLLLILREARMPGGPVEVGYSRNKLRGQLIMPWVSKQDGSNQKSFNQFQKKIFV